MASSNKRKTTFAKMNRERRLVERRLEKQARKEARKRASAGHPDPTGDTPPDDAGVPEEADHPPLGVDQ